MSIEFVTINFDFITFTWHTSTPVVLNKDSIFIYACVNINSIYFAQSRYGNTHMPNEDFRGYKLSFLYGIYIYISYSNVCVSMIIRRWQPYWPQVWTFVAVAALLASHNDLMWISHHEIYVIVLKKSRLWTILYIRCNFWSLKKKYRLDSL